MRYENNLINIRQFNASPHPYCLPNFMDAFSWSLPFVSEKVTDVLLSILDVCTEDELESAEESQEFVEFKRVAELTNDDDVSSPDVSAAPQSVSSSTSSSMEILVTGPPQHEPLLMTPDVSSSPTSQPITTLPPELKKRDSTSSLTGRKQILRSKVRAIAKMSRMFSVLREEHESIILLKGLIGSEHLPRGVLLQGSPGIHGAISSIDEVRRIDQANERMPPLK